MALAELVQQFKALRADASAAAVIGAKHLGMFLLGLIAPIVLMVVALHCLLRRRYPRRRIELEALLRQHPIPIGAFRGVFRLGRPDPYPLFAYDD